MTIKNNSNRNKIDDEIKYINIYTKQYYACIRSFDIQINLIQSDSIGCNNDVTTCMNRFIKLNQTQ
jgi:hypothetical protein